MREATLYGMWPLLLLADWIYWIPNLPLGISDASLLWTLFVIMVVVGDWPHLETNLLCFWVFWTIYILIIVYSLSQKPLNSELIVRIFEGPSMFPNIHRHLVCELMLSVGTASSLVSQLGQGMQLCPERDHLTLVTSWVMIRAEGVGGYIALFWKFRSPSWPFLGIMLLFLS